MSLALIIQFLAFLVSRVSPFPFFSFTNVAPLAQGQARGSQRTPDPARTSPDGARLRAREEDGAGVDSRPSRAKARDSRGARCAGATFLLFACVTAAVLGAVQPAAAVGFAKVSDGATVNITIDWGTPGGPSAPAVSNCLGRGRSEDGDEDSGDGDADGDLCHGDPLGKGRAAAGTGDADACSSFGWATGHGNTGGVYSAWKNDGQGPRGPGRGYWAVCVKDKGGPSAGNDSVSEATARYTFDLDDYLPAGHVVREADLSLDYVVDAEDFNEGSSRAILYAFIRDLDTGLYYKIRGDQGAGGALHGTTDEEAGSWHGCDYIDVWDARVLHRPEVGAKPEVRDNVNESGEGYCGEVNETAKPSPRAETSRDRSFASVCASGAASVALGQNFSYGNARCSDILSLADLLNSRAAGSRRFELVFRLVVRANPGANGAEKFAMAFDDPLFIKSGSPQTPRYGASFAYGASITFVCQGTPGGGNIQFHRVDHNHFSTEVMFDSRAPDATGTVVTTWNTGGSSPNGTSGIDYMTGWWVRCIQPGVNAQSAYTKVYLVNPDPEVYLRGRAYMTYLPFPDGYSSTKGNGEGSNGDHDEDNCERDCDLADESGKLWITIKLGKRGSGGCTPPTCYSSSRTPVSGSWGESALAQTAFLGCTSESSCAGFNTAGSFRLAQENQQGDNLSHSSADGHGHSPCYPSDPAGDYDRDFGRGFAGGSGNGCSTLGSEGPYTGTDSDTDARVQANCATSQPPSNDGTHGNWDGGQNDCEFLRGRWAKFLFGAAAFRGDGTVSLDTFWWTVGLWLDDRHVVALGQHTVVGACAPTDNTNHGNVIFTSVHGSCLPVFGDTDSPEAANAIKIWVANTVDGCSSWTSCGGITDLTDYVNRTVRMWDRLVSNLFDDMGNLSETYPNDGSSTSITALTTHFLKALGEPSNPRYVSAGGGACATQGVQMNPPTNPAGIIYNLLRTSVAGNHASNDPFSIGVSVVGSCVHASIGDTRPPLRDGAALTLPSAAALLEDKRDQWFIRMNNPAIRPLLDSMFRNITLKYARGVGPANGTNGLNYFWKGLVNADPKAWSDFLSAWNENGRDFKFFGGVVLNEQMARAFNPQKQSDPSCTDSTGGDQACGNEPGDTKPWGDGVDETANNASTVTFLNTVIDLAVQGLKMYNLYLAQMNDENPTTVRANAEGRWGHAYWLLKVINTYFSRMPQDKFNASLEEKTRWISINNYGNPGNVDYLGVSRGPSGGCGNWVYQRSGHTTSDPDSNDNDLHNHDGTAHTNNRGHPQQYRDDVLGIIEAGNPVKQDAGYASLDSGWNYLLCRLQFVTDENYKNLADTLLETIGGLYKAYYSSTRYGQNAIPASGREPTVSDFSTQLIAFISNYLDHYRVRPTKLLYDDALIQQQSDELGFSGNNDYYFDNIEPVVINGVAMGRFSCNDGATSAQKCRDRYYYEKAGYSNYLYKFLYKILDNIDFGSTGAFYNLTKLRVERAPDLAGDPQGATYGLTYALNYGRNLDPAVRQRFARVLTDYIPLYLQSRFDSEDQNSRLTPEARLDAVTTRTKLLTFGVRWLGEWGDLMFSLRGLRADYYAWTGGAPPGEAFPEPFYVLRTDDNITFNWGAGSPAPILPSDRFSVRWRGKLDVVATRDYRIQYCRDGGINLTIDNVKVSPDSTWTTPTSSFTCSDYNATLSKGLHDIRVEYYDDTGNARVELRWNRTQNCPANACEAIPKERFQPPYPYDYTFSAAGTVRWIFAVFNTIYESFSPEQHALLARTLALNASRYFGDLDGCSGRTGAIHTELGRHNTKCPSPPLAGGISSAVIQEQHEVNSRALSVLFKALGLAFEQLPNALPDLSSTTDEGIVFLEHVTEMAKRVFDQINSLPTGRKNVTYDRYWAYSLWGLRSFQRYVNLSGAGIFLGPIKASATQGQIAAAGTDLALNLHKILGDAQARSGLNYLLASIRVQDESKMRRFTDNLLGFLTSYVQFNSERSIRFPAVFVPDRNASGNIQEYTQHNFFQKANGTLGVKYLLDPVNEINGLWGHYYDFRSLTGKLFVASDDGANCNVTTTQSTAFVISQLAATHDIYTDYDATVSDRWDHSADVSPYLRAGPVLIGCQIRDSGGSDAGFDAALKVGARFRIQRSDDDSNYHPTAPNAAPQIPGCTAGFGDSSCNTRDYQCDANEVWRYSTTRPAWWPDVSTENLGDEITTQDLTDGTAAYGPFASTAESWGCANVMPISGDLFVWKRVEIDPFEEGRRMLVRNDRTVDFCFGGGACDGSPDPAWLDSDNFAARWAGKLSVPTTRDWRLRVCANDGVRLYVDGLLAVNQWRDVAAVTCYDYDSLLEAGLHDIQIDYYEKSGSAEISFQWNLTFCCEVVGNQYLFTRDPSQYNQSAQTFFGMVYGASGTLNSLYALAAKGLLKTLFDTMAVNFSEYWGSFGGVHGRSYSSRHEATNASLDYLRNDYARGSLSAYRNLLLLAGKAGEQAAVALPNATSAGFLRMWDFPLPASLSATEKNDLCRLATQGLSGAARRFYYFGEDNYPESWTTKALRLDVANGGPSALSAATNCAGAPFTNITNASALRQYLLNNSTDSVIVMLKDVCPNNVCDTPLPNAVVYHDTNYPTSWIGAAQAARIADFFNQTGAAADPAADPRNPAGVSCANQSGPSAPCGRSFVRYNATQLAAWMQNLTRLDRARGSVALFSQDICPDSVCENQSFNNTLSRYLSAGGRVVWIGDVPFYYQGLPGGGSNTWGFSAQEALLGISCLDVNGTTADCAPAGASISRNADGTRWGLTQSWFSARPAAYKVADTNFTARYWNNAIFSGAPAVTREETVLDFWFWRNCPQWATDCNPGYSTLRAGAATPDRVITNTDAFSSEWTGTFYLPVNSTSTFISNGDDSRAVVVDGSEVTDANNIYPSPASCAADTAQRSGSVALTRGFHTLIYRQCEIGGDAGAQLEVQGSGWPGTVGMKAVRAVTTARVLAHHPLPGQPSVVTNISAFQKNFNPVVPDSGFVRIWDCQPGGAAPAGCGWDIAGASPALYPLLRDLWNVSTFNLTLEVHGGQLATGATGGSGYKVPDINVAGNDTLLLDYIRRGGRVVWIGDVPLWYQGHPGTAPNIGNRTIWEYGGEKKALGVRTADAFGSGMATTLTWEGFTRHGLGNDASVTTDTSRRPAYIRDLTYVYRKVDSDNASWWFKEFNDSIVSYKRRTTEFRTHALDGFTRFLSSLESAGDWEKKITTYWANRYWVQLGAVASYKAWVRQTDILRQFGSDIANASITLIGRNESQGLTYILRAEQDVDWTAGRGPWGRALLNYTNQYFGFQAQTYWNPVAGASGLGINTTLRKAELSVGPMAPGATAQWSGVAQA